MTRYRPNKPRSTRAQTSLPEAEKAEQAMLEEMTPEQRAAHEETEQILADMRSVGMHIDPEYLKQLRREVTGKE